MSGRANSSSALLRPSFGQRAGRVVLIAAALVFLGIFLLLPVAAVFAQAFSQGWTMYRDSIHQEDVLSALLNLGYQRAAAEKALAVVAKNGKGGSFDAMFRDALAALSK